MSPNQKHFHAKLVLMQIKAATCYDCLGLVDELVFFKYHSVERPNQVEPHISLCRRIPRRV